MNKSSEDFEEEEKFIAFTTEGHSLGGSVVSASFDGASPQEYAPSDALGPSGVVRVVLSDGTQHRVTVNCKLFKFLTIRPNHCFAVVPARNGHFGFT